MKENKDAYFCSGLFTIDKEKNENEVHFDFYVPSSKKMFSFSLNGEIELKELKIYDERIPEEIHTDFDIDLEDFIKTITKKMENEGVKNSTKKFLFSFQVLEGKAFLLATIFLSNLGLLKVNISIPKGEIVSFEKKSLGDIFKVFKKNKKE